MSTSPQGELARGSLIALVGSRTKEPVEFMFNPTEYSISKRNTWNFNAKKGGNVPEPEFGGGEAREMQVELFFDAYLRQNGSGTKKVEKNDVRTLTNKLFNLMMIDRELKNKKPNSKMGEPPRCRFCWGKDTRHHFECCIRSCNVKYTLFDQSGVPIRATATLTLVEVRDSTKLLLTNPTSGGEPGPRVHIIQDGDRLDLIAFQEFGDATQWRRIAEANQIANPLALRAGMTLQIPG